MMPVSESPQFQLRMALIPRQRLDPLSTKKGTAASVKVTVITGTPASVKVRGTAKWSGAASLLQEVATRGNTTSKLRLI